MPPFDAGTMFDPGCGGGCGTGLGWREDELGAVGTPWGPQAMLVTRSAAATIGLTVEEPFDIFILLRIVRSI